jgi:hypothetical protein
MAWPQSQDYNEAIQVPGSSFADPELHAGTAITNAMGLPMPRSGNFADVYQFQGATGAKWAIKCFTREVPGLQERYHEISKYLRQAGLPFTVDFTYLAQGIRIGSHWYPVLKMQWVEGFLLNEFVRNNLDKPSLLQALGRIWLRLARRLRDARLAHADLQHGNVILVPGSKASSLAVKLIDYDGMFVPALAHKHSGEVGHPAYQHAERLERRVYNAEVDRLPLLAIACALRAITVGGKALWDRYDNSDNLLFREADLRRPGESALCKHLWNIPDAGVHDLLGHLTLGLLGPLEEVPLLQDLFVEGHLRRLQSAEEERVTACLGAGARVHRSSQAFPTAPARSAAGQGMAAIAVDPWEALADDDDPVLMRQRRRRQAGSGAAKVLLGIFAILVLGAVGALGFWFTRKNLHEHDAASKLAPHEPQTKQKSKRRDDTTAPAPPEHKPPPNVEAKKPPQAGSAPALPMPVARWSFTENAEESIHGIKAILAGGAVVADGRLQLDGNKAYLKTEPLPFTLGARSLEVWTTLADLDQGDSSVMQIVDGRDWWDGILYATMAPRKWYPGSSFNQRSQLLDGPGEDAKPNEPVHLVLVSHPDNNITLYRNGKVYDSTFRPAGPNSELQTYKKGDAYLVLGANGGSTQFFAGAILAARLYDVALNEEEITALYRAPPGTSPPRKELADADDAHWLRRYEGIWSVRYADHDFTRRYVISPRGQALLLSGDKLWEGRLVKKGKQHILHWPNQELSLLHSAFGKLEDRFFFPAAEYPYQPTFLGVGSKIHSFRDMTAKPDSRFEAFTGIWSVQYANNMRRVYSIASAGKVVGVNQTDFLEGSLSEKDGHVLLDFGDDKLERLKISNGRLFVEHFNPARNYPATLNTEAVGDRVPETDDIARLPLPKKSELATINSAILMKYKEEYARRDPVDHKNLARRLLRDAAFVKGPRDRYAYFQEALAQAAQGFDFPTAFEVIHELDKSYDIDPLNLKVSAIAAGTAAARASADLAVRARVAEASLLVLEDAKNADAYALAAKLVAIANEEAARTNNSALKAVVKQQSTLLDRFRVEYDKLKGFRERLRTDPKDPEANLKVGKFVAFSKGNWDAGLPLLLASNDKALSDLARQDLDNPEEARTQAGLGASWWALAEEEKGPIQVNLKKRARFWFRRALPGLSGNDFARAEEHLTLEAGGTTLVPGLVAEYFADEDLKTPAVKRIDYALNFHWGRASPGPGIPADHFSVRWRGFLSVPHTGVYMLGVSADDGCRLFLDGQLLHDAWKGGRRTGRYPLSQGLRQVRLEHHEGTGGANMLFFWSLDGVFAEQPVRRDALYHRR